MGKSVISEKHRQLNTELHEGTNYGADNAHRWINVINNLTWEHETFDVLDYGCGKGNLAKTMTKMAVKNYDPAVEEFSDKPEPADIVICTDVMEHVEPECLDAVIEDLKRVTNIALVLNIALRPAKKDYSDGTNTHLIVEDIEFWMDKFKDFELGSIDGQQGNELNMVVYKRRLH